MILINYGFYTHSLGVNRVPKNKMLNTAGHLFSKIKNPLPALLIYGKCYRQRVVYWYWG